MLPISRHFLFSTFLTLSTASRNLLTGTRKFQRPWYAADISALSFYLLLFWHWVLLLATCLLGLESSKDLSRTKLNAVFSRWVQQNNPTTCWHQLHSQNWAFQQENFQLPTKLRAGGHWNLKLLNKWRGWTPFEMLSTRKHLS